MIVYLLVFLSKCLWNSAEPVFPLGNWNSGGGNDKVSTNALGVEWDYNYIYVQKTGLSRDIVVKVLKFRYYDRSLLVHVW